LLVQTGNSSLSFQAKRTYTGSGSKDWLQRGNIENLKSHRKPEHAEIVLAKPKLN